MPVLPVVRASIERALNVALANDPRAKQRLAGVQGKCFRLHVLELPEPMTLFFYPDAIALLGPDFEAVDGSVTVALADLFELSDASKVTQMLQAGKVKITGDPVFAQQAAQVFLKLDIDFEEMFANYLGDVPGYWLAQGIEKLRRLKPRTADMKQRASDVLTNEMKLAASPLFFALYQDDVQALRKQLDRLEKRVDSIAKRHDLPPKTE